MLNVIAQMLVKVRVTTCIPYKGCTQLIINSIALQMFATKQVVVTKSGICRLSTWCALLINWPPRYARRNHRLKKFSAALRIGLYTSTLL